MLSNTVPVFKDLVSSRCHRHGTQLAVTCRETMAKILMNNECHVLSIKRCTTDHRNRDWRWLTAWRSLKMICHQELFLAWALLGIFHMDKWQVVFQAKGGIFAKSFLVARDESGRWGQWQIRKGVLGNYRNWTFCFKPWGAIKCFKGKSGIVDLCFRKKKKIYSGKKKKIKR